MAKFTLPDDVAAPKAAKVDPLPTLACVGYPEAFVTKEGAQPGPVITQDGQGDYFNIRIRLRPAAGTTGKTLTTNFLFHPGWFDLGFDPESLKLLTKEGDPDFGKKVRGMYARVVQTDSNRVTVLEGLLATQENWGAFWRAIRADAAANGPFGQTEDQFLKGAARIYAILRAHLLDEPPTVGYIARQSKDRVEGVLDERGKPVYELRDQYEIDGFFLLTKDVVKGLVTRAKKAVGNSFLLTFDPDAV